MATTRGEVYTYRAEMGVKDSRPMREYDYLYQNTADGRGIPWEMGMFFPTMAMQEGYPQHLCKPLVDAIDHWMARFMLKNRVRWIQEKQRGGNNGNR